VLLVFPEGTRGLNKPFKERYQLQRFGLGFMRLALENDVPIIPVGVVGAEEQAPAIFDIQPLAKLLSFPHFPITLTGLPLPMPVRYRLWFGEPMRFTGRADDEDAVLETKVAKVRDNIAGLLAHGLAERENVFW
jgi:1-acyl-sn-glycerol-3-phosphate acyltransferase